VTTIRYLSTLSFPDDWLDAVRAVFPDVAVEQIPAEKPSDVPEDVWAHVDVLQTSAVLPEPAAAPRLRWVQLDTSGVDHLRDHAIWTAPVEITTIGGVSPVPLAEYAMFAVLGMAHRLPAMLRTRARREWPTPAQRWQRFLPASLDGATVVVLGYGRIGREIGRLARAHGMTVVGVTRTGIRSRPAERADFADFGRSAAEVDPAEVVAVERLREVLPRADFLIVVAPLTDHTRGLVGGAEFAALKPGAVLINVARGGIVDETALQAALDAGRLAGAVLDVFDDEPLPPDSPWWDHPLVLATPHVAGLAPAYSDQVQQIVVENLRRFLAGEPLLNRVDRVRGY
jgi:phosphoglycerate dehydrogenase-like enzyme